MRSSTPARAASRSAIAKAGVSSDLDALAAYVASLNTFAVEPVAQRATAR